MKGKIQTYLLILVVIGIWGVLIYKFASDLSDDTIASAATVETDFKIPAHTPKESFELLPIENDPFLGTPSIKKKNLSGKKVTPVNVDWPQIAYTGMVANGKGNSKVFIIQINGQDYLLQQGENIQEIKLIKGNSEKITLRYKGQSKEILIQ